MYKVLPLGTVVSTLENSGKNTYFTRYLSWGTANSIFMQTKFRNDSIAVFAETGKFYKLKNYDNTRPVLPGLTAFSYLNAGRSLDQDNYLMTIPDFYYKIGSIDSIIKRDSAKIYTAKNLILDLRNNNGGRVKAYKALLPLVYTRPIRNVKGTIRCSDDLIAEYKADLEKERLENPTDTAGIKKLEAEVARFERARGHFVADDDDSVMSGPVLPLPVHVGIIINYGCQSAAELFLLHFKQSDKVKLFGENTFGAVDYLNATFNYTPSGRYAFTMATARRTIPEGEEGIDGMGIAPDVPIADTVPDWVAFVKNYYRDK